MNEAAAVIPPSPSPARRLSFYNACDYCTMCSFPKPNAGADGQNGDVINNRLLCLATINPWTHSEQSIPPHRKYFYRFSAVE
jgi:hypothetical protein